MTKVKEETEKAGLKLNIKKTKIMASIPITSWQLGGEKVETVADFLELQNHCRRDGDCSHEIKILASLKKSDDKPRQCIKKQRHHFAEKVCIVKATVFSSSHVQMAVRVGL